MACLRRPTTACLAFITALLLPAAAEAHGISQRADLPLPVWLFAWAAAVVLLVSFAALTVLWSRPRLEEVGERRLLALPPLLDVAFGLIGIAVFTLVVYAGLVGNQSANDNIAPTTIFVIFWIGFAVLSALVGDIFAALSPWRALGRGLGWLVQRLGLKRQPRTYPERLGRWPAAVGILLFAWVELIDPSRGEPRHLAVLALIYCAVMLVGMAIYGADAWSRQGDAFAVTFSTFACLAPLYVKQRQLFLRPPLVGATSMPETAGSTALVLVLIGSTSFDGFSQGRLWLGPGGLDRKLVNIFSGLGSETATAISDTIGLMIALLVVTAFYAIGISVVARLTDGYSGKQLWRHFAHSLIPIALGYLVAHYASLLIFQGQATISLASDPLGHGRDFLGTSDFTINYGLIGVNAIWYLQVLALVIGHVCGLVLAHDRALRLWPEAKTAARSQYGMLAVMVVFTCLGLWLLSAVAQ